MARVVMVMGDTGTGKSRSVKNLNPDETYIINPLGKDLPFKGYQSIYSRDRKVPNIKQEIDWKTVRDMIPEIINMGFKSIIIDDARHIMEHQYILRAGETGWGKFIDFAQQLISIINMAKDIGTKEQTIFFMFHIEDVFSGQSKIGMKTKLVGKFVEEHFNPLEIVTINLVTYVSQGKDGKNKYQFVTNRTTIGGVEYPAKSPEEMFPLYIDNDLELVRTTINNYYKGESNG